MTEKVAVFMTVYQWHMLLSLIEDTMRIIGGGAFESFRHGTGLYKTISNQLHDAGVEVIEREESVE